MRGWRLAKRPKTRVGILSEDGQLQQAVNARMRRRVAVKCGLCSHLCRSARSKQTSQINPAAHKQLLQMRVFKQPPQVAALCELR